jgi:L-fuculose-phosphate aldolase
LIGRSPDCSTLDLPIEVRRRIEVPLSQAVADPSFQEQGASLIAAYRRMRDENLIAGTAGNVSTRDDDVMLITPSTIAVDAIEVDDIARLELSSDEKPERGPSGAKPSSEWMLHRSIYRRTNAKAIVHTHSIAAVAVSTLVDELPAIHYYISRFADSVPVAPYATFGTLELAELVGDAAERSTGVLMRNHGAVVYANSLDVALERAATLEWLCDLWLRATTAGRPSLVTPEQLADVRAYAARLREEG